MLSAAPEEAVPTWFRKRNARDTRADLAQAEHSLSTARQARAEQQRKREEQQTVIAQIGRLKKRNNIAQVIRQALQQGPASR